jgi:hypothetical protein
MSTVTIPSVARSPLEGPQYVRNGRPATSELHTKLAELVGQAARLRTQLHVAWSVPIESIPDSDGDRVRWRFPIHTGPYSRTIVAMFEVAPQNNLSATSPYALLEVSDDTDTVVGESKFYFGASASALDDYPSNFGIGYVALQDPADPDVLVDLAADTDYTCVVSDMDNARIRAVAIWEIAQNPDTDIGYPAVGQSPGAPIFDEQSSDEATMIREIWHRGGQTLIAWTANRDADAPSQTLGDLSGVLSKTLDPITISAEGTVSTPEVTWQANGTLQSAEDTEVTVDWPAHVANDVGILFVRILTFDSETSPGLATPDGWSSIGSASRSYGDGTYVHLHAFYRRATSSSEGEVDCQCSSLDVSNVDAFIVTVRNATTSGSPIQTYGTKTNASTTNHLGTALFVSNANSLELICVAPHASSGGLSSWSQTGLTITERLDDVMGLGTAPVDGPVSTVVPTVVSANSRVSVVMTIIVKP